MRFVARKLSLKKAALTALISLTACAGAPKLTPHAIDTDLMECREYKVINETQLVIKYEKSWPIEHCNNFFAIPWSQAERWKKYCLDNKCTTPKPPVKVGQ